MTTITSDQVKALPAPKAQARRGVPANPWVALIRIALLGLLGWNSLQAEALTQFSIRSTDNPSLYGGVFDDGATFSGSFLVDLSQTLQPYLVLTSWDVWTSDSPVMDPGNPNMPIIPGQHYSSYAEGSGAWLATLYPMTNWLDFDEVAFFQGDSSLFFELVEPVGLFKGGLILGASEDYYPIDSFSNFARSREDWTGSAILIDPAIVDVTSAPEPGTGAPMIAALLLLAGVSVVWRRGKAPVQEVLLAFGGQATPPHGSRPNVSDNPEGRRPSGWVCDPIRGKQLVVPFCRDAGTRPTWRTARACTHPQMFHEPGGGSETPRLAQSSVRRGRWRNDFCGTGNRPNYLPLHRDTGGRAHHPYRNGYTVPARSGGNHHARRQLKRRRIRTGQRDRDPASRSRTRQIQSDRSIAMAVRRQNINKQKIRCWHHLNLGSLRRQDRTLHDHIDRCGGCTRSHPHAYLTFSGRHRHGGGHGEQRWIGTAQRDDRASNRSRTGEMHRHVARRP